MNRDDSNLSGEELTVESLQDLLIYDDMFFDYFNVFLQLPVFPQPLEYQRLTDSFRIIEDELDSVVTCESPPVFMANDEEHDRLLSWAQKYRLPLFLKTDLFRQLKLAKLLMRPLEEASKSSRNTFLRGYSKHIDHSSLTSPADSSNELTTESTESDGSETNDSDASSSVKLRIEEIKSSNNLLNSPENYIPYDTYIRPGSEAISLPMRINTEKSMKREVINVSSKGSKATNGRSGKSHEKSFLKGSRQKSLTFDYTDSDSLFFRIQSAPLQYDFADFDFVYTNKVLYAKHKALQFGSSSAEEEENIAAELQNVEDRQRISLYRLKGLIVGTSAGMNEFKKFLKNTAGHCLCDFWLDCEQFKDSLENRSEEENADLMNKLMRNLQDKYKLNLTKLAKQQLTEAMKIPEKITILFLQAQYDSLRRLRSYWLPRYLIHQESLLRQHTLSDLYFLRLPTAVTDSASIQSGVFPKLPIGKMLPCITTPTQIAPLHWSEIHKSECKKITEPSLQNNGKREKSDYSSGILRRSVFQNRLRSALEIDTASGSPFRNYLQSLNLLMQINNLEFFQEIGNFKGLTKRNADRVLRLSHVWSIVNRFIAPSSKESIGANEYESKDVVRQIQLSKSSIKEDVFDNFVENSIKKLEQEWLRYLKEDMKKFMESSLTHRDPQSPPQSLDEVEVVIEGECIVVRRKYLIRDFQTRVKTWDTLSKEEKRKRREKALELKRITEIERQKGLKAVAQRLRIELEDQRRLKTIMSQYQTFKPVAEQTGILDDTKEGTLMDEDQVEITVEEKTPEMKKLLENKVLLSLFKKYVTDHAETIGRENVNAVMLLQDLSGYFSLQGSDKGTLTKKDHKSTSIYKSYFEKSCKRPVVLNDNIQARLSTEKSRPKTPTLKEIRSFVCYNLTEVFQEFWMYETKELAVKSNVLAAMSENELQILAESQLNEINKSLKTKTVNTAAHTKEDKTEFLLALSNAAYGALSLQMLHFYRFVVERGPEDKMNNLDKDLFFYVEVLKLKEMFHTTVDEEIAKKKVQCISVSFLESVHPPTIQINVANEIAQRAIRAVQRQMTYKDVNITIFDEAQGICLKTLLPYWAGFQRQWEETSDHVFRPVSKYQRMLERRKQMYNDIPIPKTETVILPVLPKGINLSTLSYTMNDGVKWKEPQEQGQDSNGRNEDGLNRKRSLNPKMSKRISRTSISTSS